MRHFLSCIVLGTIIGAGAAPAWGQGPTRDDVKKLEAELARLQSHLKDLESQLDTKTKGTGKPAATRDDRKGAGKAAKPAPRAAAAPARGRAPMGARGFAFGWQKTHKAPFAANRSHGGFAAGRGHGGWSAGRGQGGWSAGRGHGYQATRGRGFQPAARGHMFAGPRGFAFGFSGRTQGAGAWGQHRVAPSARGTAPATRAPAGRAGGFPMKPEAFQAPRGNRPAPASSSAADKRLERILNDIEELRADLKKRR